VLLILTAGIGASIAVFTIVDKMVLRPLPFERAHDLVTIVMTQHINGADAQSTTLTPPDADAFRALHDTFDGLAALRVTRTPYKVSDDDPGESATTVVATADLFHVLRVAPQLGSLYTADNEVAGRDNVLLISDGVWRRRFGADPSVIGRTITSGATRRTIVGVMPHGFEYPVGRADHVDFWAPYVAPPAQTARATIVTLVGRLPARGTLAQVRGRTSALAESIARQSPFKNTRFDVVPLHETIVGAAVRSWLLMLFGAVICVVLLTFVTVANLVLARVSARRHEFGIRSSLGAARWQIVRAVTVETLLLSMVGTTFACGLAAWAVTVLRAGLPATLPFVASIAIDRRILALSGLMAVMVGLLLGILPGLYLSREGSVTTLRGEGRAHTASRATHRIRGALVLVEVALAMVLAVGSGLFVSSFLRVLAVDLGIDYRHVLILGFVPETKIGASRADQDQHVAAVNAQVRDRLARYPGIERVAVVQNNTPLSGGSVRYSIKVEGQDKEHEGDDMVNTHVVTPEYMEVVKLRLLRGRWLNQNDMSGAEPVVVVSDAMAHAYFPSQDPLTARLSFGDDTMRRVVGIVASVRGAGPEADARPEVYEPVSPLRTAGITGGIIVRTTGDPLAMRAELKKVIASVAPMRQVAEPQAMEDLFAKLIATRRFQMTVLSVFGITGVLIAAIGIYGVMAYIVAQRTKEIGVRMALGATAGRVVWGVFARAFGYLAIGLAAGLCIAWAGSGSVANLLFKISPHDPRIYASAVGVLAFAGVLAAWIPARRAARVDPLLALRLE
jgi:predicted permease